ncbi:MAG: 2OG-Fe(II) oxygenase [Alphaproteobacteria bacterium]|nr:2OG-Fe(II) oxygenase [Alphaproteobacteria bacterium]
MTAVAIANIFADPVDGTRYRLDDPAVRAALVAEARRQLAHDGCAILPSFVTPKAVARMAGEVMDLLPHAHRRDLLLRAYPGEPDESVPAGDPRRRATPFAMNSVATDQFDPDGPVMRLYIWDGLTRLVADMLDEPLLYRVADPLMSCNATILGDGDQHGWHFDSNDFVISLLLQAAEAGGRFEFAPAIRGPGDENLVGVAAAMDGTSPLLRQPPMAPGALILFRGRNSLHRVTPVLGARKRIIALFSYDRRPDMHFAERSRINVFGRSQPIPRQPARPGGAAMPSSA